MSALTLIKILFKLNINKQIEIKLITLTVWSM